MRQRFKLMAIITMFFIISGCGASAKRPSISTSEVAKEVYNAGEEVVKKGPQDETSVTTTTTINPSQTSTSNKTESKEQTKPKTSNAGSSSMQPNSSNPPGVIAYEQKDFPILSPSGSYI